MASRAFGWDYSSSFKECLESLVNDPRITFHFIQATRLLDSRYEQVLWPRLIKKCFPHMPKTIRKRNNLSRRFNRVRHLRNRIFHHEPVWYWQDLAQQHQDVLEAIGWVEPALKDLVMTVDRFPATHQQGCGEIEMQLRAFC